MMNGPEKSDSVIVAVKPANKAGKPVAEWVEPRTGTKGNTGQPHTRRTQSRDSVSQGLDRVRHAERQRKKEKFTALLHHVTVDLLRESFLALKRRAAPGVDGVTWEDYEAGLEGNLLDLHARVHSGGYRALPVRRRFIPKPGTDKQRPLGIAALEDKIVQRALVAVLNAIYEVHTLIASLGEEIPVLPAFYTGCASTAHRAATAPTFLIHNRRDQIEYQGARMAGRRISSASAESGMNHLVNRRLLKRQQLRWSIKGAHCLLQTRVELLDGRLEECFAVRSPHFRSPDIRSDSYALPPPVFIHSQIIRSKSRLFCSSSVTNLVGNQVYLTMNGPTEFDAIGDVLRAWDRTPDLGRIAMPVLATCGRYNELSAACSSTIVDGVADGRMVVFKDSAHLPILEESDAYLATVLTFPDG